MTKHELQNKRSMSIFFRSYKDYFKNLLGLLSIIKESSPKTIIDWIYIKKVWNSIVVFGRVFWSFEYCIEGFKYCRPLISVDGRYFYG